MSRTATAAWVVFLLLSGGLLVPASAEDVQKKWRIGLGVGGFNPVHDIGSPAANVLTLREEDLELVGFFPDPRNDSTAFGNLDVKSGPIGKLSLSYGLSKIFLVEASVGYNKTDLGDVALDVQFLQTGPPIQEIAFNFTNFRVPVGEIERIPIQVSAIARFRPRASFNPYFGAGLGYAVQGFKPSDEFNELSFNLDSSRGTQQRVGNSFSSQPTITDAGDGKERDLDGATVDVRDTFEWHLIAGADVSFSPHWSMFGDIRWTDASREVSVGFNGSTELGVSVPQLEDYAFTALGQRFLFGDAAGPMLIKEGGLIDGGQIVFVHKEGYDDSDSPCTDPDDLNQKTFCEQVWFPKSSYDTDPRLPDDFEPDNELDPGNYYVHGGTVSIDGFTFLVGVRYTF